MQVNRQEGGVLALLRPVHFLSASSLAAWTLPSGAEEPSMVLRAPEGAGFPVGSWAGSVQDDQAVLKKTAAEGCRGPTVLLPPILPDTGVLQEPLKWAGTALGSICRKEGLVTAQCCLG